MGLTSDIAAALRDGGERPALEHRGATTSWRTIAAHAEGVDTALTAAGLHRSEVIGVLGRNRPLAASAFLSVLATGRCVALLNPFQPPERIAADAAAAGAAAVLLEPEDAAAGDWIGAATPSWVMEGPGLRRHAAGDGHARHKRRAAILAATSGTTGAPKRIPLRRPSLERALREIAVFHRGFGEQDLPGARQPPLVQYSPLAHVAGALTLVRGGATGRSVVLLEKFDPAEWTEVVRRHRLRVTGLPPAMMRMVLESPPAQDDLRSLVSVWSGSAPVDPTVETAFTDRYGIPVLGNYGATEFCGAVATWSLPDYRAFREAKAGAVGRLLPEVAWARVRDPVTSDVMPPGETGVLELMVHRMGRRWLPTTDLAHIDRDNFLFLHGRADDAINRGGFKILPDVVVATLRRHPAIRDAAVVGLADARLGEAPVAAIELRDPDASLSAAEVIAYVKSHLPAYFAPIAVEVLGALPRTPSMKVDRQAVRALFSQTERSDP